jgi:hypothetical protein
MLVDLAGRSRRRTRHSSDRPGHCRPPQCRCLFASARSRPRRLFQRSKLLQRRAKVPRAITRGARTSSGSARLPIYSWASTWDCLSHIDILAPSQSNWETYHNGHLLQSLSFCSKRDCFHSHRKRKTVESAQATIERNLPMTDVQFEFATRVVKLHNPGQLFDRKLIHLNALSIAFAETKF